MGNKLAEKNRLDNLALGLDIGGTLVKIAICNNTGEIIYFDEQETPSTKSAQFCDYIGYLAEMAIRNAGISEKKLIGVGVGFPGTVNSRTGFVHRAPNIKGWKSYNVKAHLEEWLKLPVLLNNDANLALLSEFLWGAAEGCKNVIMLTLGTGVGGGILIGGKLYTGADGAAGELGHIIIDMDGSRCTCGKYGCLESFIGRAGVIKEARKIRDKYPNSILWTLNNANPDPETIQEAAGAGDSAALETIRTSPITLR
jgi:glucokinase